MFGKAPTKRKTFSHPIVKAEKKRLTLNGGVVLILGLGVFEIN